MKKFVTLLLVFALALAFTALPAAALEVGDIIEFGDYDWRVLDVQDGKILIITEKIIFTRAYHEHGGDITWGESTLRHYLNNEFYNTFTTAEQLRIIETTVINEDKTIHVSPDNPGEHFIFIPGGGDTTDKIFILNEEEAIVYFIDASSRMAFDDFGNAMSWWLRTLAWDSSSVRIVPDFGGCSDAIYHTNSFGYGADIQLPIGVRPALWLDLTEKEPVDTGVGSAGVAVAVVLLAAVAAKLARRKNKGNNF